MAKRSIRRTVYRQKAYVALTKNPRMAAEELSERIGCSFNSAAKYISEWKNMTAAQRNRALRDALKMIKEAREKYGPDPKEEEEPEKQKPQPAVQWGFRTQYSAQKQQRSRSLITHY